MILKRMFKFIWLIVLLLTIILGCGNISYNNNSHKEVISKRNEMIKTITPTEAKVDLGTWIGVDMATINYASNDRIVIHGNFGLFIYDLNEEKIIRGIDVKAIGCGSTQGDNVCVVSVSKNGNIIRLHPSSSENMYVYNVENNTLIRTKYEKSNDELKTLILEEEFKSYDGEYCYSYIKLENEEVSYLRCPKSNMAIDLQYIKNDKVYDIFK
jgi:hypothetical protein